MTRRNRRCKNQDLATVITQALVAVLPTVIIQIQHQLLNQQPPNNSPNQNSVNHTHTEPPEYDEKVEKSTDTHTTTITTKDLTAASKRKTKRKRNDKQYPYAIPAVPLQQIPSVTQPNKKPYNGTFPYCNTCTHHHPLTSVCRFCTHCNKFGHFINHCLRAKQFEAQTNQAGDSSNSSEV